MTPTTVTSSVTLDDPQRKAIGKRILNTPIIPSVFALARHGAAQPAVSSDRRRPPQGCRTNLRRRRHRRRWLTCLALGAIAALGVTSPAMADPFGLYTPTHSEADVGAIPDNFNHTYCFSGGGWTTAWQNIVHSQMANLDAQTFYFDTFPLPATGCFPTTDVWFELNSSMSPRGTYGCRLWNNGVDGVPNSGDDRCEGATIRINSRAGVLTDDHQRRKTTCHEIGHSVGLAHSDTADDCMRSRVVPAGTQWERYNEHHIKHVNSRTPSAS